MSASAGLTYHDKTKISDRNDLKFDTVVVLDSLSKLTDFRFKKSKIRNTGSEGHHFEFLTPSSYLWNGCSYKVQI